jgi:biotin-dependent carboxylase-like uncharacterized protein
MSTAPDNPVLEVIDPGMGITIQDLGRIGWRRFGVPMSGAMDDHSARAANVLLDNPLDAPVLEMLMQGQRLRLLQTCWLAVTGADASSTVPDWHAVEVVKGSELVFPLNRKGVWTYLAVAGGFLGEIAFGSASVSARAGIGRLLKSGDHLCRREESHLHLPAAVAGRVAAWDEQRDFLRPPTLRVWRGPQWEQFDEETRQAFFETEWQVSSQSDRTGYRLTGPGLSAPEGDMISEPVRIGSIQIPAGGQPIVTMRDGPTVGGYPKLGMVDPRDLSWLVQCRPGQGICFRPPETDD